MPSTLARRQLGYRLKRLREACGKTQEDVETAGLGSTTKLWRIENGRTAVKIADVRALCWLYGADQQTTDVLANLATGTTKHGWWEGHGDAVADWFNLYVDLEASADSIQIYDPELVHGLLQIPDYVRALVRASNPQGGKEAEEKQIKLRAERQQLLYRHESPLLLSAVFGAAVLSRPVGGRQVIDAQVARLRELAELPHVDVRILPWEVGAHAALHTGAFTILSFDGDDDPDIVYQERHSDAQYREKPKELAQYREMFGLVYQQSVPIKEYRRDQ